MTTETENVDAAAEGDPAVSDLAMTSECRPEGTEGPPTGSAEPDATDEPGPSNDDVALGAEAPANVDVPDEPSEPEVATLLTADELPKTVEALLFASAGPLSMSQLKELTGMSADALQGALTTLGERYAPGIAGVVLSEVAAGWLLSTGEGQKAAVRKLLGVKPQRLTRAALETLALVAYRQPVTRPEMEDIRGVDCGAVLKALLERKMVKILGKKEEPGRPLLYGTTREFLEFFGLKSLSSLPTLREFHELTEESRSIVEKETGEPVPSLDGLSQLADGALSERLAAASGEDAEVMADLEAAMAEAEARAKVLERQMEPAAPAEGDAAASPTTVGAPPNN